MAGVYKSAGGGPSTSMPYDAPTRISRGTSTGRNTALAPELAGTPVSA